MKVFGLFLFVLGVCILGLINGLLVPYIISVIPENEWKDLLEVLTWIVSLLFTLPTGIVLIFQGFVIAIVGRYN